MTSPTPDWKDVTDRLERLERHNRKIKQAATVAVMLISSVDIRRVWEGKMAKSIFLLFGVLSLVGALAYPVPPQGMEKQMDKVYADESHCLVGPEIRGNSDNLISCYCRDAIADARYVYFTYIVSGKDRNLNGIYLALLDGAKRQCSLEYDVILKASETENWKWSGPEVTRTYPPDSEIERITPDGKGFRLVKYKVRLTHRDQQGRIARVENFTATELLPPNPKK